MFDARNRHLVVATSGVFVLGNALFALSLATAPMLVVWAGCVGVMAVVWTCQAEKPAEFLDLPIDFWLLAGCFGAASALFILGGAGHFLHAINDWLIRDAILADVSLRGLPLVYGYESRDYLLRAPVGMYMLPSVVGHSLGLFAAHMAQLFQNAILLASIFYVFASLATGRRLATLTLFMMFAGLDVIPTLAQAYWRSLHGEGFWLPTVMSIWTPLFSYWYHVADLFWTPNHTLPGWWFAALTLLAARRRIDLASLTATVAPLALWSPLAVLTAPVFLVGLALREPTRELRRSRNYLALSAACLFIPVAIYLTSAAESIESSWMVFQPWFAPIYVFTLLVQIPQIWVLLYYRANVPRADAIPLVMSVGLLLLLPLYSYGPFNDSIGRGAIPAMAILGFEFAVLAACLDPAKHPRGRRIILAIVVLGAFGPGFEIMRSFVRGRFAISDCSLLQASQDFDRLARPGEKVDLPSNYIAPVERMPGWLMSLSGKTPLPFSERTCWPDHPMVHNQ